MANPHPETPAVHGSDAHAADPHAATTAAEGHDAGGGLPQFESQHWAGQMGYLLILFAVLYVLIAKVFTPRLRKVMAERADTISTAVATARRVQTEAADQAAAAKADVARARAESRSLAADAKARVTADATARAAIQEAEVNARIETAEAEIAKTRDAAMTNVAGIAADTTKAIVEHLTGKAATAAELKGAA